MPASYVLPQAKQTDGTAYLKGTLAPRALFPRLPVSVAVSVKWGTVSGTRAFIGLSHAASFGAIVLVWNNFWSTSVVYCKPSSGYELVYLREDRGVPISSTGSLTRGAITAEPSYTVLFGQRNTVSRGFQGSIEHGLVVIGKTYTDAQLYAYAQDPYGFLLPPMRRRIYVGAV